MKKIAGLVAAILLFVVILVVVVLTETGEDVECVAPGSGGHAGGSAPVNAEGLAEPLDNSVDNISSAYKSPDRPGHRGIDIAQPLGTPIYALTDGTVSAAGTATGFGHWVVLDHDIDGTQYSTVYGHMYADGIHVSVGDTVKAGEHIADVGSDGESSGPHLHFEVWEGGRLTGGNEVDPTPWVEKASSGDKISSNSQDEKKNKRADKPDTDDSTSKSGTSDTSEKYDDLPGGQYTNPGEVVPIGVPAEADALEPRQIDNIRAIISIGKGRNEPKSFIKSALMAAGQEGGYRQLASQAVPESLSFPNDGVTAGDAKSVGIFAIQVPMNMSIAEGMDRETQINWFYDTANDVAGSDMEPWQIAAKVERPREDLEWKYQNWESLADELLRTEGNIEPSANPCLPNKGSTGKAPADASEFAKKAIAAAREQNGLPYVWGGGDANGPTGGGFDCSGLTLYAYAQASDGEIQLPHFTGSDANPGQLHDPNLVDVAEDDIQPGDLLFFGTPSDTHHVGIALGDGQMIHAPDFGQEVTEVSVDGFNDFVQARRVKEDKTNDHK